jgi:hypothetical protein
MTERFVATPIIAWLPGQLDDADLHDPGGWSCLA